MRKWILQVVGLLSLGLGVVGIFLPLLPTTPFLLLSASCFCRSSPRLYHWLLSHPWFGPSIKSYRELRAIPLKVKIFALVILWITMGYLTLWVFDHWLIIAMLLGIAFAVSVHLLRLKNLTSDMTSDS